MKIKSILFFVAMATVAMSCDLFNPGNLIPANSSLEFTLDGTQWSDDEGSLLRAFGAATKADTTVVNVTVPDASTGRGMQLNVSFGGDTGVKNIEQGLNGLNLIAERFTLVIYDEGQSGTNTKWDATNISLDVTSYKADDNGVVTMKATFSGTIKNRETEATARITKGSMEITPPL